MSDASPSGPDFSRLGDQMERAIDRIVGGVSAESVFGKPERVGDRLVITAAAVQRGGGFGFGGGSGATSEAGAGGGGGGGAEGRPVAVIEIGPDGVRVRPILDFTRIGLTVLAAALTVLRARRGRRS